MAGHPAPHLMAHATSTFIALGGNRVPSAGDWAKDGDNTILAYGAGRCIALWDPKVSFTTLW